MALQPTFAGSGEFVPDRVWSCPVHDCDTSDPGDPYESWGDPWDIEGEVCLDCVTGKWQDKRDAEGNVVLREVGLWEHMLISAVAEMEFPEPVFLQALLSKQTDVDSLKFHWLEDELKG